MDRNQSSHKDDNTTGFKTEFKGIWNFPTIDAQLIPYVRYSKTYFARPSTDRRTSGLFGPFQIQAPGAAPGTLVPNIFGIASNDLSKPAPRHTFVGDLKFIKAFGRWFVDISSENKIIREDWSAFIGETLHNDSDYGEHGGRIAILYDAANSGFNPFYTRIMPLVAYRYNRRSYRNSKTQTNVDHDSEGHQLDLGLLILGPVAPFGSGFIAAGLGWKRRDWDDIHFSKGHQSILHPFVTANLQVTQKLSWNLFIDRTIEEPGFIQTLITRDVRALPMSIGFSYDINSTLTKNNQTKLSFDGQLTHVFLKFFTIGAETTPQGLQTRPLAKFKGEIDVLEGSLNFNHDYFRLRTTAQYAKTRLPRLLVKHQDVVAGLMRLEVFL